MESETKIRIDSLGRWWNDETLIVHEGVLRYFKANLFRDSDGRYLIRNRFGEREEIGRIQSVAGFPLFAERADIEGDMISLLLDSGHRLRIHPTELLVGGDDLLWTFWKAPGEEQVQKAGLDVELVPAGLPIPVRLSAASMTGIGRFLEEKGPNTWVLRLSTESVPLTFARPEFDRPEP